MHRVGGLEKADKTGNVDYTPENHALMGQLRAAKIERIADDYPELEIIGDADADMCVLGWGSTWAAIHAAVQRQRRDGQKLAWIHLTHLNPLPKDLGEKLQAIPEGARPRAQPRPAVQHRARQVPRRRQVAEQGRRCAVHHQRAGDRDRQNEERLMSDTAVTLTSKKDWSSDQEVRWCPGCGDYGILQAVQHTDARARHHAREDGVHLRHRVLEPVPVLHEHVRDALDPRARPGDRHGPRRRPARPRRVGDHR